MASLFLQYERHCSELHCRHNRIRRIKAVAANIDQRPYICQLLPYTMKIKLTILFVLFVYCLITSFQCKKYRCIARNLHLEGRSWLPPKGTSQLTFVDNLGSLTTFKLQVVDTTIMAISQECENPFSYDYLTTSLYLNPTMSDSIYFSLTSGGWLCMRAMSGNIPNMNMCNVFGQTKEGVVAKKLSNQSIGNRTYQEVILLFHGPGLSDNIDSIFIANNVGTVGFKYANKVYALQ